MNRDRMQASRFELKYVISESKARQIRQYVRSFLELDDYGVGKPEFSYPVHSLYLDSDRMKTYWDTVNGNKNRFKLRIRYYNDDPDAPVFLEIKRRMDNCIRKQRAAVRRDAVRRILAGQLPPARALISPHPKQLFAAQAFCRLVQGLQAKPRIHVAYLREAYLPPSENSARLTLDRQVRCEPDPEGRLSTQMRNPILVWGNAVVLELKFTDRYPNWFGDLVRQFELRQCGAAKYADGFTLLSGHLPQHHRMPAPNPDFHWPVRPHGSLVSGPAGPILRPGSLPEASRPAAGEPTGGPWRDPLSKEP